MNRRTLITAGAAAFLVAAMLAGCGLVLSVKRISPRLPLPCITVSPGVFPTGVPGVLCISGSLQPYVLIPTVPAGARQTPPSMSPIPTPLP